jgi:hypothetical protein
MKNQTKVIGKGFKFTSNLFGASIQGFSAAKFINKENGVIAVALEKNNVINADERVYRFETEQAYQDWKDSIHEGNGRYLHYADCGLLARAYPVLTGKPSEEEEEF